MKMFRKLLLALALLVGAGSTANAQTASLDGCPNAFVGRIVRYFHKTDLISVFNFIPPGGGTIYDPFIVDYGNNTQTKYSTLAVIEPYKQGRAMYYTTYGLSRYVLDTYNAPWRHSWWLGFGPGVKVQWRCTRFLTPSGWMQAMEQLDPFNSNGGKVEFYKLNPNNGSGDGGGFGTGGDGQGTCSLYISGDGGTITSVIKVCH